LLGRLCYRPLTGRLSPRARTTAIVLAAAGAIGVLAVLGGPAFLLLAAAVALGAVRGATTLVQATAVADRWGTRHYGTLSGVFAAPMTAATAIAPWAGTTVAAAAGGYPEMFAIFAALAAGAAALAATEPSHPTTQPS
jgi:MFS family permease